MSDFYNFANNSPILTFLLFVIIGDAVVGIVRALCHKKCECECNCEIIEIEKDIEV